MEECSLHRLLTSAVALAASLCTGCATPTLDPYGPGSRKANFEEPAALASTQEVTITTAILEPDPQAGMKSTHRITIDFDRKSVTDKFETGTTDFFGISLASVRNRFRVENVAFSGDEVRFRALGETASGVGIVPNINYRFDIRVNRGGTAGDVTGCHDGYPSYEVRFGRVMIYWFKHRSIRLLNLFGTCDQPVDS